MLGFDFGEKRIGISVSDEMQIIATPLTVIKNIGNQSVIKEIEKIIKEFIIIGIVIGMPMNMNGNYSEFSVKVKNFSDLLAKTFHIPIVFWDERLSSIASENALIECDVSRKKRKTLIDKVAASYILQGALDFLKGIRNE